MVSGAEPIEIIRGDSLTYKIELEDKNILPQLERIMFTSKELGVEQEMTKINDTYSIDLTPQITQGFPDNYYTTFDLTLFFANNIVQSQTGISMLVNKKQNPVTGQH